MYVWLKIEANELCGVGWKNKPAGTPFPRKSHQFFLRKMSNRSTKLPYEKIQKRKH